MIALRKLEEECRYDVCFQFILNGECPSYKTWERYINQNLSVNVEELLTQLNGYIMDQVEICKDVIYIDGTKYEAYTNKMTFVWKKATDNFYARNWAKANNTIQELNTYFKKNEIDVKYSIIKESNS